MPLTLESGSEPSTPPSSDVDIFAASGRLYAKRSDGSVSRLGNDHPPQNVIVNGSFRFFQRQTPGTLTTYSNTSGRSYGPDRWGLTNESASVQSRRVDTLGAFESGLQSRYYCEIKKITSAGKVVMSQAMEGDVIASLRGRSVRVQFKAKNSVGSHTIRCALLALVSPGTVDTIPATFVSAFGSNGTDPTWGSNLSAVAPSKAGSNSSISGSGLSSALTSSWRTYGGVFVVPTNALNLVAVFFTNAQMAADDIFHVGEVGLHDGEDEREFFFNLDAELARCQRYYQKTFEIDVAPVQAIGSVSGCARFPATANGALPQRSPSFQPIVRMRAAPTATSYNPISANAEVRDSSVNVDCSGLSVASLTTRSYALNCTGNASTVFGNTLAVHISLDAEL